MNSANPTLVVLSGYLKGEKFMLSDADFSIGREAPNSLCLRRKLVSRQHAVIRSTGFGQFIIIDLDSRNGTFINAVPVKERKLEHGDRIQIGDSLLLFLLDGSDLEASDIVDSAEAVRFDDEQRITTSLVQLRREDSVYSNFQIAPHQTGVTERTVSDLRTLLKICTEINSTRGRVVLQRRLLELIFDAVPADSGAILLSTASGEPVAAASRSRGSAINPVVVSRRAVQKVMETHTALLSNEASDGDTSDINQSLARRQVQSVLAVPLLLLDKMTGVIYLETKEPAVRFDEGHLQLMMGIAGAASVAIENATQMEWLESENRRLQSDINIEHNMVGESPRMRAVYQFIAKVAPVDSTVLIRGESGTGKELVAAAIHSNSPRSGKPFVAINCAALTETLLESELFGHERGAFTGAIAQKKGRLEVADGGTVFLDEIGELAPALQAKILRVLQERRFERVGGTRSIDIDIRLIAATNRDLEKAIQAGTFRQDLFYRLNVLTVTMPPLRERREDIPLLAGYFAMRSGRKSAHSVKGISLEARKCIVNYDWPGNVRELENAIERAIVLGTTELIMPEDLPDALLESKPIEGVQITQYHQVVKETKRRLVLDALEQTGGSYTEAAQLLGVHPNNLHRLIRNLDLKLPPKK
jgi:transcriptional regulator with GAF, ATPase, and Fis domain